MLIVLIATLSGCASMADRPSHEELLAAVRRRDAEAIIQISQNFRGENPDKTVMVHSERIERISDAQCDEGQPAGPSINCTFKVKYPSSTKRVVAELSREGQEWVIIESMSVTLTRRNVR